MIEVNGKPIDYSTLPVYYMRDSVELWIEKGFCSGGFLTAFLTNDLRRCVETADDQNRANIVNWVRWFYQNAPSGCWGSVAAFERWQHKMENTR